MTEMMAVPAREVLAEGAGGPVDKKEKKRRDKIRIEHKIKGRAPRGIFKKGISRQKRQKIAEAHHKRQRAARKAEREAAKAKEARKAARVARKAAPRKAAAPAKRVARKAAAPAKRVPRKAAPGRRRRG